MAALTPLAVRMGRAFSLGSQRFLVLVWNGADDVDKPRDASESEFFAHLGANLVQRHRLVCIVSFNELRCNP